MKTIIMILVFSATAAGQTDITVCDLLQVKENRLYFNCGTEAGIYPCADFSITTGEDTIYSGEIEFVHPGIAISFPIDSLAIVETGREYAVNINKAEIDSVGKTNVYIDNSLFDNFRRTGLFTNSHVRVHDNHGKDQPTAKRDILLSLYSSDATGYARIEEIPAPFYFVMIPNPEKKLNNRGYLSTALYYHHNLYKAGLLFEGDNILEYNRHFPSGDTLNRIYDYSTVKGGKLYRGEIKPGQDVKIYCEYRELEEFCKYFATFISRYGCHALFTDDAFDADIRFTRAPIIPDSASAGMRHLLSELREFKSDDQKYNEKLTLAEDYLDFAEKADNLESQYRYLAMADNILQTELGVFPLFRPMVYLYYRENITGRIKIEYDAVDFENISRLRLPRPGKDSL